MAVLVLMSQNLVLSPVSATAQKREGQSTHLYHSDRGANTGPMGSITSEYIAVIVYIKHRKNCKCCPGHSLSVSQPSKVSQKSHNSVYQCLGSLCDVQQALIFSWLRPRNQGTDNVSVIELSWTDRKNISSCHISFRYESSTLIFCKGPLYCFSSYIVI